MKNDSPADYYQDNEDDLDEFDEGNSFEGGN